MDSELVASIFLSFALAGEASLGRRNLAAETVATLPGRPYLWIARSLKRLGRLREDERLGPQAGSGSPAGTLSGSSGPGIGSTGAGGRVSGVSGDSGPGSSGTGSSGSIGG
ncbi:MAG: hypothetical protein QOE23_2812 [Pseudonocardiales bacterium]|nr:hypothetical protein [Pseudonocardiales bacterium]